MSDSYNYQFIALRGRQAGRAFYTIMCPLKLIPRIFIFNEEELGPELRAQRILNKTRVPEIARYLISNPDEYVLSSITASVDVEVGFVPLMEGRREIGTLTIPMSGCFVVNDGQHRRAAIEEAIRERPDLGEETISVVLFIDAGLRRSQQMFADLNKHATRPTMSLGILYDHRDPCAELARNLAEHNATFKRLTELEKSSISNRSKKLFTLSSIYQATKRLLGIGKRVEPTREQAQRAHEYWEAVGEYMPDWQAARDGKIRSSELRMDYIHAHGIALQAIAVVGACLFERHPRNWREKLERLEEIDWSRSNAQAWEGRALVGGRLNKTDNHVILTANYLKMKLGLSLDPQEQNVEDLFSRGRSPALSL